MKTNPDRRKGTWRLVAAVSLLLASACSKATTTGSAPSSTGAPPSTPPGTIQRTFLGAGTHPTAVVEASSPPWTRFKGFALSNGTGAAWVGVGFWDVGEVPRNPCHPIGHESDPGPTVDDLVAALEAQSMRHATTPTDVTLAGYSGKYIEWSVPTDMKMTGDSDFTGCDVQSDGHRNFVSWEGAGGIGQRWQQMPGQVDRLWILDVNGQRLVIDASYSPESSQALRDEEYRVVESLRFVNTT